MSYNINSIRIVSSDGFCISKTKWKKLNRNGELDLPEINILDDDWLTRCAVEKSGVLFPNDIWWEGECSGSTYDTLKMLLTRFSGDADIIVTWEDGETSGLRLRDGHVTEPEVVQKLADE